jgi:hypothetical protein
MVTTHAALGALVAAPLLWLAPELAPAAALAGAAGGVFPDADMLVGVHRKSLHYPDYYWLLAVPAVALAALVPGPATVAAAVFLVAAALHSVSDWLGGASDTRPWEPGGRRGVYFHAGDRWLPPRRWVRYDGAPEDLALTVAFSVPAVALFGGTVRTLALGGLALAVPYTVARKRIPQLSGRFPAAVRVAAALLVRLVRR